ncbi:MAG: hypothetical protein GY875_04075 [Gammaproteobacteria bacterium]|nr:hypothetical protein [Gammaproteobacteria bacterium]
MFETITIVNGASVDFGDDRVIINDAVNSTADEGSLSAGDMELDTINSLVGTGGILIIEGVIYGESSNPE